MTLTVTEALAELKVIGKRVEAKEQFIKDYLYRQAIVRDPHADKGGTPKLISEARQAIRDLEDRKVKIRLAIQQKNLVEVLEIDGLSQTVAGWLTWRKEISPGVVKRGRAWLEMIRNIRAQTLARSGKINPEVGPENQVQDILINTDELELSQNLEKIEAVLGTLDGRLSLFNATTTIEV